MPGCELEGCGNSYTLDECVDCERKVCSEHWSKGSHSLCLSCSGEMPVCDILRCDNNREILNECNRCGRYVCSRHWIGFKKDLGFGDYCTSCEKYPKQIIK